MNNNYNDFGTNQQSGVNNGNISTMPPAAVQKKTSSNKMTVVIIAAVVVIALCVAAFFYFFNPKQQILGKWKTDGTEGMTFTFNNDGSAILEFSSGSSINIAYAVQDNNDLVLNYAPGITSSSNKIYKYDSSAKNTVSVGGEIWYVEGDHLYIGNDRLTKISGSNNNNSETTTNYSADAKTLDIACKVVSAGVKVGTINKGTTDANGNSCEWAAEIGSSNTSRSNASKEVIIANVQQYEGTSFDISLFVYATVDIESDSITKGTILYKDDDIVKKNSGCFSKLTTDTKLGDLYGY